MENWLELQEQYAKNFSFGPKEYDQYDFGRRQDIGVKDYKYSTSFEDFKKIHSLSSYVELDEYLKHRGYLNIETTLYTYGGVDPEHLEYFPESAEDFLSYLEKSKKQALELKEYQTGKLEIQIKANPQSYLEYLSAVKSVIRKKKASKKKEDRSLNGIDCFYTLQITEGDNAGNFVYQFRKFSVLSFPFEAKRKYTTREEAERVFDDKVTERNSLGIKIVRVLEKKPTWHVVVPEEYNPNYLISMCINEEISIQALELLLRVHNLSYGTLEQLENFVVNCRNILLETNTKDDNENLMNWYSHFKKQIYI